MLVQLLLQYYASEPHGGYSFFILFFIFQIINLVLNVLSNQNNANKTLK